jgi:hypothetical protein
MRHHWTADDEACELTGCVTASRLFRSRGLCDRRGRSAATIDVADKSDAALNGILLTREKFLSMTFWVISRCQPMDHGSIMMTTAFIAFAGRAFSTASMSRNAGMATISSELSATMSWPPSTCRWVCCETLSFVGGPARRLAVDGDRISSSLL